MKTIILAAGTGTRMSPLTDTRPKVMLTLANRPIIEHVMLEAKAAGITDYIFIIGHHAEQITKYFGDGSRWEINISYCQQSAPLGTADAVLGTQGLIDDNFLLLNGDNIIRSQDITSIVAANDTTMGIINVSDPQGLGVVDLDQGKVQRIHEKAKLPPSSLANAGIYLLTPDIFGIITRTPKSPRQEYEITTSLQLMIDEGLPVYARKIDFWLNLSHPWDLLAANEYFLNNASPVNLGEVESNVVLKGKVIIGPGTVIKSGAYIIGPTIIGANCDIGPNCYIRPYSAIGDSCHIGAAVEVKNSIIMTGSKLPHHNYVGDSIIGEQCNFGAGTKIANLRLDKQIISVAGINTQRRKLGAIIGDRVETGINSSINVGACIGNNTFIGPGVIASGIIVPESRLT